MTGIIPDRQGGTGIIPDRQGGTGIIPDRCEITDH
jgi:hypothetical protein